MSRLLPALGKNYNNFLFNELLMSNFDFKLTAVLALIVVSSGCVSLNINHEIHKDGSSDIGIQVDSDSELLRNSLKEQFETSFATENAVLDEGDDSFTYRFENVYPQKQEQRFSDAFSSNELNSSATGFSYEKDSGLLYTHFTLRMNSSGVETSETDIGGQQDLGAGEGGLGGIGESLSSGVELNYNVDPFGEVVDTNGQELEDGTIRFDLTEEEDYYVEFKALSLDLFVSNIGSSDTVQPDWSTSDWSECSKNGTQTREVTLQNDAENYMFKPPTERECEYQTQNSVEEMTLEASELDDYSVSDEGRIEDSEYEEAFERTFEMNSSTLTHTVIKPSASADEFISSQVEMLESDDYESDIEFISEADTTEAYSKVVNTETVTQGSGSFTYEEEIDTVKKIVLASRYDVVHRFTLEGESSLGIGIDGIENFDSIASQAMSKTE